MVSGPVEEAAGGTAGRGGRVGRVGHQHVELGDGAVVYALVEILADVAHLGDEWMTEDDLCKHLVAEVWMGWITRWPEPCGVRESAGWE